MTFYFDNGATATKTRHRQADLGQRDVSVANLGLPSGTFGLYIKADRQISAQINITRDGKDGDNLLGNTGLDKRWYLAEGYTGLTFHETVSILNPPALTARTSRCTCCPSADAPGATWPSASPAHTNTVVDINSQMPSLSLSIIADSDQPVVVERTLTFSSNGYGLTTRAGTHTPATSWIFAEGTTVNKFQTFLTILNPNPAPALVTASFFGRTGGSLGSKTLLVAGRSRANLKENDFLSASGIATVLTSNLPVVVERPEYFGSPNGANIAGSDVFGRNGAGVRWSFPGGNTPGQQRVPVALQPLGQDHPGRRDVLRHRRQDDHQARQRPADGALQHRREPADPRLRADPRRGAASLNGQGFVAEQTVFAPNHSFLRSTQGLAQ